MYVYRVQHRQSGIGPYDHKGSPFHHHPQTTRWPLPSEDGVRVSGDEWRYGFSSIAKYKAWFTPEERRLLRKHGFKLVRVKAEFVVRGRRQLAFLPRGTL